MRRIAAWMLILAVLLSAAPAFAQGQTHTVQSGDTLFSLARRYGTTVEALRTANRLSGDLIYVGQVLIIPTTAATPQPDRYTVQPGDTLINIGVRYHLTVPRLMAINQLTSPIVFVGQSLIVSAPPLDADGLPLSAQIANIGGRGQALPLDCETRSAVDWAAFFGVAIDELTFFNQLPVSDNPDKGFVGSVHGAWGQVPPQAYGVHAEPIAAGLRAYNVSAVAQKNTDWKTVRTEIAANRPVIVWVTGHVDYGTGQTYTASDGSTTLVAPYEHTVMAIGYTADSVIILDGSSIYTRPIEQFKASWGALGNQVVMKQ
ncbi:MAG: LysM peptidoglycan-binding domain-containing protein [Anaerolineae bacterium]